MGQVLAFETGNAPYGITYNSPEHPLFNNPLIGAVTGTQFPQQFPVNVPPYSISAKNPDPNVNWPAFSPINGIDTFSPGNKTSYAENYFLSFERQLGGNTVFDASYIGNQGHHLLVLVAANPGNAALCLSLSQPSQVAPGSPTCGPFGENLVYTRSNGQVVNGTRQPFGNDFGTDVFQGHRQLRLQFLTNQPQTRQRRADISGSYTYGKSLDQASNLGEQVDPFNVGLTRAVSSFDIRHNFVASYRYDLPLHKIFRHRNSVTKGWSISGITRFSSGLPVTLVNPNDTALIGSFNNGVNGNGFANLDFTSGNLSLNHDPRNGQPYFNTSLFSIPSLGSPGTAPRRFFYGPGIENWDIALLKETPIRESTVLELRLETFNTFNHAQFFGANSVDGNINDATFGQVVSAMPPAAYAGCRKTSLLALDTAAAATRFGFELPGGTSGGNIRQTTPQIVPQQTRPAIIPGVWRAWNERRPYVFVTIDLVCRVVALALYVVCLVHAARHGQAAQRLTLCSAKFIKERNHVLIAWRPSFLSPFALRRFNPHEHRHGEGRMCGFSGAQMPFLLC